MAALEDTTNASFLTEWPPFSYSSTPPLTELSVFPNLMAGLGGRTLRMVTLTWDPFTTRHHNKTHTWYTGLCMDVLDILTAALNFTYVITEPPDQIWGHRLPNGTWAGMTGMLHRQEADFALAGLSVTDDRATVSDYTTGFYFDEIVLVTTRPDPTPVGRTFYFRPFHWLVYVLLGCGLLVMTVILVWIERWYVRVYNCNHPAEDRKSEPTVASSAVEAAETLFGAMLGRAVVYEGVSTSGRLLLCTWLLLSLVTAATYTGKLTSNSVVTKQRLPFKSLSELVKRTDYRWGVEKGTMMDDIFSTSSNKDYKRYYQKMLEFAADDPDVVSTDMFSVALSKVLKGNYVQVSTASDYEHFKSDHCELVVVQERLFQDTLAVHLQKGSPYTKMFNQVLGKAREFGLLEYLRRKWFPKKPGCYGDQTTVRPVSLELVQTAFVMAAAGLAVAAMLLALECLMDSHRQR